MCGSATEGLRLNLTIFKFDIINMHFLIIDMRHYLIMDKSKARATEIQEVLEGLENFRCLAIISSLKETFKNLIPYTPDVLIINLDNFAPNVSTIVIKIKKSFGLMPQLIGITTSYEIGFKAYSYGFTNVIGPNIELREIKSMLRNYEEEDSRKLFCIYSYQDFRYIALKNLILIRADNRTTDFILKNGSQISGLNYIKHYTRQLPDYFIRVNRSYIINAYAVQRINFLKKQIQLSGTADLIPFTRHYLDNVDRLKTILAKC